MLSYYYFVLWSIEKEPELTLIPCTEQDMQVNRCIGKHMIFNLHLLTRISYSHLKCEWHEIHFMHYQTQLYRFELQWIAYDIILMLDHNDKRFAHATLRKASHQQLIHILFCSQITLEKQSSQ